MSFASTLISNLRTSNCLWKIFSSLNMKRKESGNLDSNLNCSKQDIYFDEEHNDGTAS